MDSCTTWRGAGLSDIGLVRPTNQDAFAVLNQSGLWVVADGMGGHAGGDVASRIAVEATVRFIANDAQGRVAIGKHGPGGIEAFLREAIASSHRAILSEAGRKFHLAGMGTTIVILLMPTGPAPCAAVAHVGDSRAYLLRKKCLHPLTRDHSAVEEYVQQGLITPAQALVHPDRHILSRALGIESRVEPDVSLYPLEPDDLLLLCTDGLTKMLDDLQIAQVLLEGESGPEARCRRLIEAANATGGLDNTTVVVVEAQRGSKADRRH